MDIIFLHFVNFTVPAGQEGGWETYYFLVSCILYRASWWGCGQGEGLYYFVYRTLPCQLGGGGEDFLFFGTFLPG